MKIFECPECGRRSISYLAKEDKLRCRICGYTDLKEKFIKK